MAAAQKRGVFTTFDGLRGVAALLVVSRHVGPFFGPLNSPESFLAVDMFFLLSGFVIANAYAPRLEKGGFVLDFLKIRLIRLYPLYLAGLVVAVVLRLYMRGEDGDPWSLHMLIPTALLAALMLGGPPGETTHGYSLNSPSWTLLPEIGLNLVYALVFRWLTVPVLVTLIGGGGAGSRQPGRGLCRPCGVGDPVPTGLFLLLWRADAPADRRPAPGCARDGAGLPGRRDPGPDVAPV